LKNPVGERRKEALRVEFDRSSKIEFHGTKVTSDAGLLPFQELDEVLGMTDMVADILTDTRIGPGKDVSPLPGMLPPSH